MIIELRALIGNWEGESPFFLGAVEKSIYKAIREEDEADGTERWKERCEEWIKANATGIVDTREVDIKLKVPDGLFATPTALAAIQSTPPPKDPGLPTR